MRRLILVAIAVLALTGCASPKNVASEPESLSYTTQIILVETVRAYEKQMTVSPTPELIVTTCQVISAIRDMPADVGMFNQVYCSYPTERSSK